MNLLEIVNLKTYFPTPDGVVRAVDRIDLSIREKETFGLVGETRDVFGCAKHPYTQAPLSAAIRPESGDEGRKRTLLKEETASPLDVPAGCRFHTRCPRKGERCMIEEPKLVEIGGGHRVACHFI